MNEIPAKVIALLSLESGLFIGLGIILYHSLKVVHTATVNDRWHGFRSL